MMGEYLFFNTKIKQIKGSKLKIDELKANTTMDELKNIQSATSKLVMRLHPHRENNRIFLNFETFLDIKILTKIKN